MTNYDMDEIQRKQDSVDDQENIRQMKEKELNVKRKEWEQIRLEMESGSSDIIPKENYFEDRSSMALILKELKDELKSQGDTIEEFEKQDWQDEGEWIAQGW